MRNDTDDPRTLHVAPPLRCSSVNRQAGNAFCGELARWERRNAAGEFVGFFCDDHSFSGDVPIDGEHVFRRVRLTAHVYVAGITSIQTLAVAEAVERFEKAVRDMGGVLDVIQTGSEIGRGKFQAPRSRPKPVKGKG